MLGEVEAGDKEPTVLADMAAGLGTLSLMQAGHVDYVFVIAEPSAKSLEVARRAMTLAHERNVGRVLVLAIRVHEPGDFDMMQRALPWEEIIAVPEDRVIEDATARRSRQSILLRKRP